MSEAVDTAGFVLLQSQAEWLGPARSAGDQERWRIRLTFAPRGSGAAPPFPSLNAGNFQLIATDGGPPAAVVGVTRGAGATLALTVAKLSEAHTNSEGRWFRVAIVNAPAVVAQGAAAQVALRFADPTVPPPVETPTRLTRPPISYLARDYPALVETLQASLRLLDPQWQDVSAGDVGVTLTELLAYAADELSYYQDAVATEAYLSTARRRLSVRRHARQLGYSVREGCNARAWVQVQVLRPLALEAGATLVAGAGLPAVLSEDHGDCGRALQDGSIVFETLTAARLRPVFNQLRIYDWTQETFSLSQGATACILRDAWAGPAIQGGARPRRLDELAVGDVLMFEHVGGDGEPPDPTLRWPVRLQRLERLTIADPDDAEGLPLVSVAWADADGLPWTLPVSDVSLGRRRTDLSIASGNMVAADQGRTVHAPLPPHTGLGPYTPPLPAASLIYAAPSPDDPETPASVFSDPDPDAALAAVRLLERTPVDPAPPRTGAVTPILPGAPTPHGRTWTVRRDLLSSGPYARDFVVEPDTDRTQLRFGDGRFGRRPDPGAVFTAVFRTGDMSRGGVAREAIATLVTSAESYGRTAAAVVAVRNPLAASGATPPDPVNVARRLATAGVRPEALAALADYEAAALAFRDVDQAAAELETGGSWPTIALYIRRRYGRPADAGFCADLAASLADRMIGGRRLVVRPARPVGLSLVLDVLAETGRFGDEMRRTLEAAFSPVDGFFCLDRWALGATVYASAVVAEAQAVSGVLQASVTKFDRLDRAARPGAPSAFATFGPHEYPSVDNRAAPHFGRIAFRVRVAP